MLIRGPIEVNCEWLDVLAPPPPTENPSEVAREVADMIVGFGVLANLYRISDAENLFGGDDSEYQLMGGPIPVELNTLSPEDLNQKIDASASVLPGADVTTQDRLQIGDTLYRVQTIDPQNWFGTITHKVLKLVIHHG